MNKLFYLFYILLNFVNCLTAQDKNRKENINLIFDKMELQGVDTKNPLLYGYFFLDIDQSKLEKLKDELLKNGYTLVRLEKTDKQEFILHVEKTEAHSRATILERENQLDTLAIKFQVAIYDGWDVGNADPSKPLVSEESLKKTLDNKTSIEVYKIAKDLYDSEYNNLAIVAFQKCIDLNYRKDTCLYKQGISYLGMGLTKIGIKKLEDALKINPKYFKACYNIGVRCYDLEDYEKSMEYYRKAEKINAKDDRIYYGIAASQFVLGQLKDAEMNCIKALKLNPNNNNARILLDRIQK